MLTRLLATAALVFLMFTPAISADMEKTLTAIEKNDQQIVVPPSQKSGACSMAKTNQFPEYYYTGYEAGDGIYTYFDPTIECVGADFPFEITHFAFTLYNFDGSVWPVEVEIAVYINSSGNACDGPETKIYSFPLSAGLGDFAYPAATWVPFPAPCTVNGPFFIGIEYVNGTMNSIPSVITDLDESPAVCDRWLQFYSSFYELSSIWGEDVGYPIFWVYGQSAPSEQWPTYAHDYGRTSQSGLTLGDIGSMTRKWYYQCPYGYSQFTSPTIFNDIVYVAFDDGIWAFHLQTGTELWSTLTHPDYITQPFINSRSAPTIDPATNQIYFGTGNEMGFVCADAVTGDIIWRRGAMSLPLPGMGRTRYAHSVILGDYIYFGDENGWVYALNKNTGDDIGNILLDAPILTSPAAGTFNIGGTPTDMLFFGTGAPDTEGSLYWINPTTLGIVNLITEGFGAYSSSPSYTEGNLLTITSTMSPGYGGVRMSYDPATRASIWGGQWSGRGLYAPPAIYEEGGIAYFCSELAIDPEDNGVRAINIATGELLWDCRNDDICGDNVPIHASVTQDPYVFYGTREGHWRILDGNTGELLISYDLNHPFFEPLTVVQGTALAKGSDNKNYAVVTDLCGMVVAFSNSDGGTRPRLQVAGDEIRLDRTGYGDPNTIQRTLPEAIKNTGTAPLIYSATLVAGNPPLPDKNSTGGGIGNKLAKLEVNAPKLTADGLPLDEPIRSEIPVVIVDKSSATAEAPTWVSWIDPPSGTASIGGVFLPGESQSFTFEIDRTAMNPGDNTFYVEISTNDPDYVAWMDPQPTVQESIEFTIEHQERDTIRTECTRLMVGINGCFGSMDEAPGYTLDYSNYGDCDQYATTYIFAGSPVVCYEDGGSPVANHTLWSQPQYHFVPAPEINITVPTIETDQYEKFESGTMATQDGYLALEKTWWAPKGLDNCHFVIQCMRLFSKDGGTHSGLAIGEAIDWDIPTTGSSMSDNTAGFVESSRLIYQQGMGFECQDNTLRFGGMALLATYVNDPATYDIVSQPYAAYTESNNNYVYPNSGFDPQEIYDHMQIPGYNIFAEIEDIHSVMTYFNDFTIGPEDTLYIYTVLTSLNDGAEQDLIDNVDLARQWMFNHLLDIDKVYVDAVRQGESEAVGSMYAGFNHEIRFWFENTNNLLGMSLGFRIYTDDGATWSYRSMFEGYGVNEAVTLVAGSRMDDPSSGFDDTPGYGTYWDLGGLQVGDDNMDAVNEDSIMLGGLSITDGLPAGPLEHMLTLNIAVPSGAGTYTLCIDSAFIPPAGDWLFSDIAAVSFPPAIGGPYCWTIEPCPDDDSDNACDFQDNCLGLSNPGQADADGDGVGDDCDNCPNAANPGQEDADQDGIGDACEFVAVCGDANGDGMVNVADAVYLISYVFKGGPPPDPLCLGYANYDGQDQVINVGDIVYLITYIFKGGPPPIEDCCRWYY